MVVGPRRVQTYSVDSREPCKCLSWGPVGAGTRGEDKRAFWPERQAQCEVKSKPLAPSAKA